MNDMKKALKASNGITLIALVITIIVLLILAGISISMLSGDNGILQRTTDAKVKTEKAQIIENAQTDILSQQTDNKGTNITKEQLATILNKYFKPTEPTSIPDSISSTNDIPLTTLDEKYQINLSEIFKGNFSDTGNTINWNAIFASAIQNPENYNHPDQTTDTRIAFGPSGEIVNLDLWNVVNGDDGYIIQGSTYFDMMGPHTNPGYKGTIDEEGRIQGEMPMYVQSTSNSNEFIPVTSLESTFSYMQNLKYDPIIPNTVKIIGENTFYGCSLGSIIIPNGVTTIESGAFAYYVPIKSMIIPKSVTSLSANSLPYALESIVVESGNTVYDSRENCNAIIETSTNTLIYGSANTVIPSTVTSIGNNACAGRRGLSSITIPGNVKTIGESAFSGCYELGDVDIKNGVESIGRYAFQNCWRKYVE